MGFLEFSASPAFPRVLCVIAVGVMSDSDKSSKTQRKKAVHELQALGEALVELREDRLATLDLPERLRDAVMEARRITAHEARRRQLQYIGKIMRVVDPAPIRAALEGWRDHAHHYTAAHKRLEALRDALIANPGSADVLLAGYPGADAPQLSALARSAVRERAANQPPRAYRELFQALRALIARDEG